MKQFDDNDEDSLVLADIRELLFMLADEFAGSGREGGSTVRFSRFFETRLPNPEGGEHG